MKKVTIFFVVFCLPFMVMAQSKNVMNSQRVFPKIGSTAAFEKALAAHSLKYHSSGNFKWRVYEITTGPDAGGYQILEGPCTWDEFDKRGDLGKEHMMNWATTVTPLLTEKYEDSYVTYRDDLSSTGVTNYSNKIAISHVFNKPGYYGEMEAAIKSLKSSWEDGKQNIAVYDISSSGEPGFVIVNRYADGLKERDAMYRSSMKSRYEKQNGAGSWSNYQDMLKKCIDHSWSEILEYRADLSAK
ncbi:hypothetical protein GALL_64400 [mine drainage metagenome]|uniref:NIPSNAP domain-containing protein n=1 Tax=mine drainage metagenome TaxID=410659 RepID=A0A1J5TEK1_9ZZZZ